MDIFAGTPFNKLFKFKTLEKSSNFWDPVFNNYDDIPSKLAQIYPNTSSIIQTNCCYQEPLNAQIGSQHSETDLTINTFNHLSPAPTQSFFSHDAKKSHII
jgi:hypothetical protein